MLSVKGCEGKQVDGWFVSEFVDYTLSSEIKRNFGLEKGWRMSDCDDSLILSNHNFSFHNNPNNQQSQDLHCNHFSLRVFETIPFRFEKRPDFYKLLDISTNPLRFKTSSVSASLAFHQLARSLRNAKPFFNTCIFRGAIAAARPPAPRFVRLPRGGATLLRARRPLSRWQRRARPFVIVGHVPVGKTRRHLPDGVRVGVGVLVRAASGRCLCGVWCIFFLICQRRCSGPNLIKGVF